MTFKPGTMLAENLARIGITPESYGQMKAAIGLPAECNCQERKEWLDNAWAWAFQAKLTTEPPKPKKMPWRTRCGRRNKAHGRPSHD